EDVTTSALPQISARYDQQAATASRALGLELQTFIVRAAKDLAATFHEMIKRQVRGVLVASSQFMFVHRQAVVDLAATHRIASLYELQMFVENGGLLSYGGCLPQMGRRAAPYRGKKLRRAHPARLPVPTPTN